MCQDKSRLPKIPELSLKSTRVQVNKYLFQPQYRTMIKVYSLLYMCQKKEQIMNEGLLMMSEPDNYIFMYLDKRILINEC